MNRDIGFLLTVIGAVLLAGGVFLPLVEIPKQGAFTMMDGGWPAWVTLGLAAAAGALALIGWTRHAVWPGLGALVLLALAYVRVTTEIERSRQRLGEGLGDDPFAAVRDLAASGSRFEYGWAVLTFGALLVIAGGIASWRSRRG